MLQDSKSRRYIRILAEVGKIFRDAQIDLLTRKLFELISDSGKFIDLLLKYKTAERSQDFGIVDQHRYEHRAVALAECTDYSATVYYA